MGCPLEVFFLGLISTQLLWKGVIPGKLDGYGLNAPDHVLVEEGLCATIPCNFTYDKNHASENAKLNGFWKKGTEENTETTEVASSKKRSAKKRFQLIGNLTAGNCSLLILNAEQPDTGNYFFRMVKYPDAKFSFFSYGNPYLNVTERQPPKIQILGMLKAGRSANITCATFASCSLMPPNFTWDGFPKHINSVLHLNGSQAYSSVVDFLPSVADHNQTITCRVNYTNEHNSLPREATIQLNVTFEPQILIKVEHFRSNDSHESFTNISQVKAQKGDYIHLRCEVTANPSASVTWVKGTEVLETTLQDLNILKLSDLKPEDSGKYTCQAVNTLGSGKASLEVSVSEPNKTLLLTATGALITLAVILLITGIILASKRYRRKKKMVADTETGNTLMNVKKPNILDLAVKEVNGVPPKPRSTHESVDGDPKDPEEIHYATLTFNAPNPKPAVTAEETQTDYAEIRPCNSQQKEV